MTEKKFMSGHSFSLGYNLVKRTKGVYWHNNSAWLGTVSKVYLMIL